MYRCDVCGVTGSEADAFQCVSFPSATDWHVCADTTACYLELWKKRKEVSKAHSVVHDMFRSLLGKPETDEETP